MDKLELARQQIDQADAELARLFAQRMNAVREIAEYKKAAGLPIRDPAREAQVLQQAQTRVPDPELREYYVPFQKALMDLSCRYQARLLDGRRAGYCGAAGAYAETAARKLLPEAELVPCASFRAACEAVENGTLDCAVLPLENSLAGEVGEVTDLLFRGSLFLNAVLELPVRHCLAGLPGARLQDAKTVLSHPQALAQCSDLLARQGLAAAQTSSTSEAARAVSRQDDRALAAICSRQAAELYGLTVLAENVQNAGTNVTRFALLSRAQSAAPEGGPDEDQRFFLTFTTPDRAGSLAQVLNIVGAHGYNLRCLRSRPMQALAWHYYFYLEAEGCIHTPDGQAMLTELSALCARLKLVGSCRVRKEPEA